MDTHTHCGIPPRKPRPGRVRGVVVDGVYRRHPLSVYPRLGQRVEECGIPPLKPRPGPARGLVLDGRYHRHPPAGDGEHRPNPNQRDGRHLAGQPGKRFERHSGADQWGRRVTRWLKPRKTCDLSVRQRGLGYHIWWRLQAAEDPTTTPR